MITGWSSGSSRTNHVQLQVSNLGVLKPSTRICSTCEGWWYLETPLNPPEAILLHTSKDTSLDYTHMLILVSS